MWAGPRYVCTRRPPYMAKPFSVDFRRAPACSTHISRWYPSRASYIDSAFAHSSPLCSDTSQSARLSGLSGPGRTLQHGFHSVTVASAACAAQCRFTSCSYSRPIQQQASYGFHLSGTSLHPTRQQHSTHARSFRASLPHKVTCPSASHYSRCAALSLRSAQPCTSVVCFNLQPHSSLFIVVAECPLSPPLSPSSHACGSR